MIVKCPHCGEQVEVSQSDLGYELECLYCEKGFTPKRQVQMNRKAQPERRHFKVALVKESALSTIFLGASKVPVNKMEEVLNRYGAQGYQLDFQIVEHRRMLLFWVREAVVMTFSKTF